MKKRRIEVKVGESVDVGDRWIRVDVGLSGDIGENEDYDSVYDEAYEEVKTRSAKYIERETLQGNKEDACVMARSRRKTRGKNA